MIHKDMIVASLQDHMAHAKAGSLKYETKKQGIKQKSPAVSKRKGLLSSQYIWAMCLSKRSIKEKAVRSRKVGPCLHTGFSENNARKTISKDTSNHRANV